MISATVLICAHNEEKYISECLVSILGQSHRPELVVVVADRCTDQTVAIVKRQLSGFSYLLLEKERTLWRNSISENLQLGLTKATGDALVIVDADMTLPRNCLETLLPQLDTFAVVSAFVRTDPSKGGLNRLVALWELTYSLSPFQDQPRGGVRAISMKALRGMGGFRDVYAWESDLDVRLRHAGLRTKLDRKVTVLHRRRMSVSKSVAYQIQAGRARRELGVSPLRTLFHSIVRLRPFVMVGYLEN